MSGQTVEIPTDAAGAPSRRPVGGGDRERILRAAAEIADTFGLDALNTGRLARRLRIKPTSLNKYFANLETIIHDLALRTLQDMIAMNEQFTRGRVERAALEALANAQRTYAQAKPGCYLAAVRAGQAILPATKTLREDHLSSVAAALRTYGMGPAAAVEVARCLVAVLQGFIVVELSGGVGTPYEADESFQRLLDILDVGARAATPVAASDLSGAHPADGPSAGGRSEALVAHADGSPSDGRHDD